MERKTFKILISEFEKEEKIDVKVDLLLKYDLSSLTVIQIQKLLDTLDEAGIKRLVSEISKKTGENHG